jgi:MATE family multidrug resistance protein
MLKETSQTIRLAFPIILGELAQMALHLLDTAMVGAVSYKQLAAAALVFNVMNIPFVVGIGVTISVSQMVSMAHGQNDAQKVSHYFYNGFVLCTLTALVIAALLLGGSSIFNYLGQDEEVVAYAIPFMNFIGLSILPMILFMTLKQFADGLEYTQTAMAISLAGLPLNALLNWLLIYGNWGFPRLELMGAGWATLITRTIMFLALGYVIFRHRLFAKYIAVRKNQWNLNFKTIKELLHIGIPSSLQLGMESGVFAVSGIIIGTIGAVEQAAHQIALSCAAFTFMVSMGLSQAASIRVSNAFGGKNFPKIVLIGKSTILTALIYGSLCALLFTLFRSTLPTLFNDDGQVVQLASYLLIFAAIFQISDSTQAVGAGILRGLKDVKVPTYFIAIAYWIIGLPIGYLLTFKLNLGPSGIWIGLTTGLALASFFMIGRFFTLSKRSQ